MSNEFVIQDVASAREYLARMSQTVRKKGESIFSQGTVSDVVCDQPDVAYSAQVQNGGLQLVTLQHTGPDGWEGDCSCRNSPDCEHVYAVMRTLLAQHSVAMVRKISSGESMPETTSAKPKGNMELPEQVEESLQRKLRKDEKQFLERLHSVYARCSRAGHISIWDLEELGFRTFGIGFSIPKLWPRFPDTEEEFWQYLALAMKERGQRLPAFMDPVTDPKVVEEKIRDWRREEAIGQWKERLANFQIENTAASPVLETDKGEYDLRLVFGEDMVFAEWKQPKSEGFEALSNKHYFALQGLSEQGAAVMPIEAEILWQVIQKHFYYYRQTSMSYTSSEDQKILSNLLRIPEVESRLLSESERPLRRVKEPLRWSMVPPANGEEDYEFRLVQANGKPVPKLLATLPGKPSLFITATSVFVGPATTPHLLSPKDANRIPAAAIESEHGLRLITALKLEMPERIRTRIRHQKVGVTIHCETGYPYKLSTTEYCYIDIKAHSEDGMVSEKWNGSQWSKNVSPKAAKKSAASEFINYYDHSLMDQVPQLLGAIPVKLEAYTGRYGLRITKKFPEIFVPWLKSLPPEIEIVLSGDLATLAKDAVVGNVRLEVNEAEIDWFDLHVVVDVNDTALTPEEIKLLLNAKGSFVRLEGKGWKRLQFDITDDEDERLARLGLSPHELTAEPQRMHALQLSDEAAQKFLPSEQAEQIRRRAEEIKTRVTPPLPEGVNAELRPYQLEGFHFLAYLATNHFGGILADDMGLGKTLQTLVWVAWLRNSIATGTPLNSEVPAAESPAKIPPVLVVCPKSVMDNWQAEALRFIPGLTVRAWSASGLPSFKDHLYDSAVHVINYSQLRTLGQGILDVRWLAVILDEGQYIKNPNSQTAQVARALHAQHRLVLSGTPIENRLLDLWSLMSFAMPGVLGSRAVFARIFDSKEDPYARRRLASRVRPFLIRRTKEQVAKDLPDRIEEDLLVEIEGEQLTLYRAEMKRAQQLLLGVKTQNELAKFQFNFLASLLRLRQICCHPALVNPDSKAESAKLNSLMDQLEPLIAEGRKVLVFSQFVEMLGLIKKEILEREWPMFYLAGDTENRGDLVREFQAAEGAAVFLISLKAGGFGLNLTAASYVVLFDPWWNPAVENQAIDRTHRIGQVNKVIAYRLLIKNSIEEKIRLLQKQKASLADDVLGEEKFAQSLTLDDLHYLFADDEQQE